MGGEDLKTGSLILQKGQRERIGCYLWLMAPRQYSDHQNRKKGKKDKECAANGGKNKEAERETKRQ